MRPPPHIRNVPLWESHCRKIRARSSDLIEGRLGVIETARVISKLAYWAGLSSDVDLNVFVAIDSETDSLPVGNVRTLWSAHALVQQDVAISEAESLYLAPALQAAHNLLERFAWALDARATRGTAAK